MDASFYASNDRYTVQRTFDRALREDRLTEDDRQLITEYVREKESSDNISAVRAKKIVAHLVGFRRFLPVPYREAGIAAIYDAIAALKGGTSTKGTPFKQNTIHDYIRILKPFLLWLIDEEYSSLPGKKVRAIRAPSVDHKTTRPDEILTIEEIEALLEGARSIRDRAFIATLYESAARFAEIARLRWGDLEFDKYGVKCYLDDRKTGKRRYVRLTLAHEYIAEWRATYPVKPEPGLPVFIARGRKPMTHIAVRRVLDRAAERGGVTKRIHPHLFRKSRITHMIARNFQESVIKESCWGNQDTGMLRTYIQLREGDMDREFLRRAGVDVPDEGDARQLERPCPRCHRLVGPTFDFCPKCAMPLSADARAEHDAALASVLDRTDILKTAVEEKKRRVAVRPPP